MRNYKNLEIWKLGMEIVGKVYRFSLNLPSNEKYNLVSQITRSAVSIPSNIAEGCSRRSVIDYRRFLELALGSAFELETQLLIIQNLGLTSDQSIALLLDDVNHEQRMISSLINTLSKEIKNK